jgi:hypothetical protein
MNRLSTFLTSIACLILANSSLEAQIPPPAPGCPNELIWTDGLIYVYDKVLCVTDIGTGNCYFTTTPGIVVYGEIVTTGCKKSPTGQCVCATDVMPLGRGSGGPMTMDVNGRSASKINKARLPAFTEFVAKVDNEDVWLKFYNFKLVNKPGVFPVKSEDNRICAVLSKPPVKCNGKNSPCTPANQFKTDISVVIKNRANGKPVTIQVEDKSKGGVTEVYKVVYQ